MKIHELTTSAGTDKKRVGRGIGSGYGKTAGRGTKGQKARTGGNVRPGFEGGQNPLAKRLPKKRGFTSHSHVTYQVVNLDSLASVAGTTVTAETLRAAGLVKHLARPIKVLGQGQPGRKLTVKVQAASASARAAIEAAGGTIELLGFVKPTKRATRPTQTS